MCARYAECQHSHFHMGHRDGLFHRKPQCLPPGKNTSIVYVLCLTNYYITNTLLIVYLAEEKGLKTTTAKKSMSMAMEAKKMRPRPRPAYKGATADPDGLLWLH